jgi:CTP:molybdopterin cytidylyltransferase MocA
MEIVSRPQPREPADPAQAKVAAIILAAGQARRMRGANKLTARFDGEPLVRRIATEALGSASDSIVVVTGHRRRRSMRRWRVLIFRRSTTRTMPTVSPPRCAPGSRLFPRTQPGSL